MAFPHASFETYTALRDMDLTHPEIKGQWRLGQMASWSRWGATTQDLAPITAHSKEIFDQLEPFTTRVILFAINLGGTAIADGLEDWRNFHTHGGDTSLSKSVDMAKEKTSGGDQIPALYMTDVFKLVPTTTGAALEALVTADSKRGIDHVGRCAAILREELQICMDGADGQAPTLVAMGKEAFEWLTGAKDDARLAGVVDEVLGDGASKRVRRMPHYTNGQGSNKERAEALHPVLEEILLEQQGVSAAV